MSEEKSRNDSYTKNFPWFWEKLDFYNAYEDSLVEYKENG
jgi:hypothetical protein